MTKTRVAPAICDACHVQPARVSLLTCSPRCAIQLAKSLRIALRGA